MTIEKMNELISKWEGQKAEYDDRMDKKIGKMRRERDLAVAAQTQKIFARHHMSAEELIKLKYASKQQLQKVLDFIEEEIEEPSKPEPKEAADDQKEKENQNHAKEVNT